MTMTTTTTTAKFSYKIEAKPDGGVIAIPADPAMERLEGSTREEVEQKIQAKVTEMIGAQLPGAFKFGGVNVTIKRNSNVTTWAHSTPMQDGTKMTNTSQNVVLNGGAAPIVPSGGTGSALRVVTFLIAVAAMLYFVFFRH